MADGIGWTDERVERLKNLWNEGLSASQIAAELGGVTRNAVIGKVHRLGLSGRGKAQPSAGGVRARAKDGKPKASAPKRPATQGNAALNLDASPEAEPAPEVETRPQNDVVVPFSERVTIMELREAMCRWPLGDPTTAEFRYCGARSASGMPYCTNHARMAYQPATERKRKMARA